MKKLPTLARKDHPRRCGENLSRNFWITMQCGSPPQVRGKRLIFVPPVTHPGITPAGAGKTVRSARIRKLTKDHPRRCGENRLLELRAALKDGSPPQVRGKLLGAKDEKLENRITPAGAGKTFALLNVTDCAWDHPRRCGENPLGGKV